MNPRLLTFFLIQTLALTACNLPRATPPAPTASPAPSTLTLTPSPRPSATRTPTPSQTSSPTLTPTETQPPGPTASPTFSFPSATVNQQAHCRYGPAKAHLHAADLYAGDSGTVRGRFLYSQWLLVKFDKLSYFCWVAPSVVDVVGDLSTVKFTEVKLVGPSTLYQPPQNVTAVRDGNKVSISWDPVRMTQDDDRGYFLELFVCQDGAYIWWTFAYPDQFSTHYTIKDEAGCPAPSGGKLYAVEKHGYTRPVEINWPKP